MSDQREADEDKPLDPATEKVRKKMMRLLVVSIGIMMVGLMAVLGAIVYKIGRRPDATSHVETAAAIPGEPAYVGQIRLPQGARISATALDGDRVLLTLTMADGKSRLIIHSLSQNRIIADIAVD
jgi:hypothetical protein